VHEPKIRDHIPLPPGFKTTTEQSCDVPVKSTIKKLEMTKKSLEKAGKKKEKELLKFNKKCGKFLNWLQESNYPANYKINTFRVIGIGNSDETKGMCVIAMRNRDGTCVFHIIYSECLENNRHVKSNDVMFEPLPFTPGLTSG
jgi:hypothetical protein